MPLAAPLPPSLVPLPGFILAPLLLLVPLILLLPPFRFLALHAVLLSELVLAPAVL